MTLNFLCHSGIKWQKYALFIPICSNSNSFRKNLKLLEFNMKYNFVYFLLNKATFEEAITFTVTRSSPFEKEEILAASVIFLIMAMAVLAL